MEPSPAVAAHIDAEAQKLQRYFDHITRCHAVVIAPHRHHQRGRHFAIHIELAVPGDRLVIDHEPGNHAKAELRNRKRIEAQPSHKDIYTVLREVFDAARRQLEDYARRRRGDVKRHQPDTA